MKTNLKHLLPAVLATFTTVATAQHPTFNPEHPDVHDPVMAKGEDGRYYIFATGMGIGVLSSADMKTWRHEPPVFKMAMLPADNQENTGGRRRNMRIDWENSTIPRWATDSVKGYMGHTWAPDISYHNGMWHLYYSCSTFGKNNSVIGLAVNKTLDPKSTDFKWEDRGLVIRSIPHVNNWNAIDPNLIVDSKGNPYMTWGSFWDGIQMVRLKSDFQTPVGKQKTISRRMGRKITLDEIDNIEHYTIENGDTIEAGENAVEAPFIIKRGKYYYLFVAFDYCCRGQNSTYRTVVGRSKKITGPYKDSRGIDMARGGGDPVIGPNEKYFGAGHCSAYEFDGKYYFVCHAYEKEANGAAKLFIRELDFDENGWIKPF